MISMFKTGPSCEEVMSNKECDQWERKRTNWVRCAKGPTPWGFDRSFGGWLREYQTNTFRVSPVKYLAIKCRPEFLFCRGLSYPRYKSQHLRGPPHCNSEKRFSAAVVRNRTFRILIVRYKSN